MQDRLAELRRQRALVAEHLAWLDRELAAAAPEPIPGPVLPASGAAATSAVPSVPADPAAADSAGEPPLAQPDPADIKSDVRRGCFLYFAAAVFLGLVGVGLIIWLSQEYKERHPPKPPAEAPAQP